MPPPCRRHAAMRFVAHPTAAQQHSENAEELRRWRRRRRQRRHHEVVELSRGLQEEKDTGGEQCNPDRDVAATPSRGGIRVRLPFLEHRLWHLLVDLGDRVSDGIGHNRRSQRSVVSGRRRGRCYSGGIGGRRGSRRRGGHSSGRRRLGHRRLGHRRLSSGLLMDLAFGVCESKFVLIALFLASRCCERYRALVHRMGKLLASVNWQRDHDVTHRRLLRWIHSLGLLDSRVLGEAG
mmetsp:Transcript_21000/g.53727  ORF Transcript_21000/g.53727 Transcript_21000/m.53727 type:complete len:236 (+) Transcript_21000:51-758(+)